MQSGWIAVKPLSLKNPHSLPKWHFLHIFHFHCFTKWIQLTARCGVIQVLLPLWQQRLLSIPQRAVNKVAFLCDCGGKPLQVWWGAWYREYHSTVRVNSPVWSFHCYRNRKWQGNRATRIAGILEKLTMCCMFFFLIEQGGNKEVYLIMKKQLTSEDVSCSCKEGWFCATYLYQRGSPSASGINYVSWGTK